MTSTSLDVTVQVDRLITLGVAKLARRTQAELRELAAQAGPPSPGSVLVVHRGLVPASQLTALLRLGEKPGFVVEDMVDLDEFGTIDTVNVPDQPLYWISDLDRGDDLRNWSPDEAMPEITARGRRPLTINEGISWLLQEPDRLDANHCFMTIASRKRNGRRLDARTPAIWISRGTGRDGRERRNAPKVGWCWAGNRHTWLGFASCSRGLDSSA